MVPVITSVKRITKRSAAAAAVCGLALLYDYICGGTQSRGLDVTLTREYPGRPPLPCGISGGGGWGGGGGGGGGISCKISKRTYTILSTKSRGYWDIKKSKN